MRIRLQRKEFLDIVSLASSVTPARSPKPILQDLKLIASASGLMVVGTDLEVAVSSRLTSRSEGGAVEVQEVGNAVVAATKLQAILRELTSAEVEVRADARAFHVIASDGEFRLQSDNPDEFPVLPEVPAIDFLEIGAAELSGLIERVEFAAARDLGRYAVNGALIAWDGESLAMIATDGRRLAFVRRPLSAGRIAAKQAIVPLKGISMFRKALASEAGTVGLRLDGAMVVLRTARSEVAARTLEGEFPEYLEVVSQKHKQQADVHREEFLGAVRRAAIVLGSESRAVKLALQPGALEVSAREEGSGEARSRIGAEYTGPAQDLGVNPDFLLEFLKLPLPERLQISFDGTENPIFMRAEENYVYVVMPIGSP